MFLAGGEVILAGAGSREGLIGGASRDIAKKHPKIEISQKPTPGLTLMLPAVSTAQGSRQAVLAVCCTARIWAGTARIMPLVT